MLLLLAFHVFLVSHIASFPTSLIVQVETFCGLVLCDNLILV